MYTGKIEKENLPVLLAVLHQLDLLSAAQFQEEEDGNFVKVTLPFRMTLVLIIKQKVIVFST